jgi:hypothetical protein
MKKFLMGAAAALAIAVPGVAAAETNAVVGVTYGNSEYDDGDDFDAYGINGAFSHDFSGGLFLQMDGEHNRVDFGADLAESYGAIHVGTRNDTYALAGFVSLDEFFALSGTGVGVEGQWYVGNLTLGGSLGYLTFDTADLEATSGQIDAAYFITPNFSVNGLVAMTDIDGFDDEEISYGIGAEYRFSSPLSVSANWRTDDFDVFEVDTWTIGLTFDLGTGSLIERQQQGPSMQGARNLSNVFDGLTP